MHSKSRLASPGPGTPVRGTGQLVGHLHHLLLGLPTPAVPAIPPSPSRLSLCERPAARTATASQAQPESQEEPAPGPAGPGPAPRPGAAGESGRGVLGPLASLRPPAA